MINSGYVAEIMRRDWGFWYTTELNLARIDEALGSYPALPPDTAALVHDRLAAIRVAIESAPKTQRWKMRARVGSRVRWYEEVEEVNRLGPGTSPAQSRHDRVYKGA
jgi:hypothetical protein